MKNKENKKNNKKNCFVFNSNNKKRFTLNNNILENKKNFENKNSSKNLIKNRKSVFNSNNLIHNENNKKINKILNEIYNLFTFKNSKWKNDFKTFINDSKSFDFDKINENNLIPKSLNEIGSFLFKNYNFWILFIEYFNENLGLKNLIELVKFIIDLFNIEENIKKIKEYFSKKIINLKINNNEIKEFCENNNIKYLNNNNNNYDFLLNNSNNNNNNILLQKFPKISKIKKSNNLTLNHKFDFYSLFPKINFDYIINNKNENINNENVNNENINNENNIFNEIVIKENNLSKNQININNNINNEIKIINNFFNDINNFKI